MWWWLVGAVVIEMLVTLWYYEQTVLGCPPDNFGVGMFFWLIVLVFAVIDLTWAAFLLIRAWGRVLG